MPLEPNELEVRISWLTDSARIEEVVDLFQLHAGKEYPSHGDLMEGRADTPGHWAQDLGAVLLKEFQALELSDQVFTEPGARLVIAESRGTLIGFAAVSHVVFDAGRSAPVRFGRIDDILLVPEFRRDGVGSAIVAWIEQELRAAGISRVFIESGFDNKEAHRFFSDRGYSVTSLTMLKDL